MLCSRNGEEFGEGKDEDELLGISMLERGSRGNEGWSVEGQGCARKSMYENVCVLCAVTGAESGEGKDKAQLMGDFHVVQRVMGQWRLQRRRSLHDNPRMSHVA